MLVEGLGVWPVRGTWMCSGIVHEFVFVHMNNANKAQTTNTSSCFFSTSTPRSIWIRLATAGCWALNASSRYSLKKKRVLLKKPTGLGFFWFYWIFCLSCMQTSSGQVRSHWKYIGLKPNRTPTSFSHSFLSE